MPPGPDSSVRITEEHARLVAKDAFFWAWPMVNIYNRRLAFTQVKEIVMAGPLIQAPLNQFGMLTDYVIPTERAVACPNQDVVYGIGALALDKSPVNEEMSWVIPENFFDELPTVLADAAPLLGEESRYAQVLAVIAAARNDPALKKAMIEAATEVEKNVIKPLFEFRNFGKQLPYHWSTITNGAAFGTDYFTRTATAKSNILVNKSEQAKYFYEDLDSGGVRLNSTNQYTVTFTKEQMPPVNGFWSLTLYNQHHFFELNNLNRYSLGTKNKSMKTNSDGSLTIYVQPGPPAKDLESNWLPSPKKGEFSLYLRTYWPKDEILNGKWNPPAVVKRK